MSRSVAAILQRQAELHRELAELSIELAGAVEGALQPAPPADDTLRLADAAKFMGERPGTFKKRLVYRKALLTLPGQRLLRYSRRELERIKTDSLARQ